MASLSASCQSLLLKLAVLADALSPQLATLLALQRTEEPETTVLLQEVAPEELVDGLESGRYNLGMALATKPPARNALPLWADELVLAVPLRSPLLARPEVSLDALLQYPLLQWCPRACVALSQQLEALRVNEGQGHSALEIASFERMAVLVAAGYGVGIAPRSRVVQARSWGVAMRPLANGPHLIRTQLLLPVEGWTPAVERFAERAAKVAASESV
jgi:DNA-binding transcriptional LysR family regulator